MVAGLRPQSQDAAGIGFRPSGTRLACLAPVSPLPRFNKALSNPFPQVLLDRLHTAQLSGVGAPFPLRVLRPIYSNGFLADGGVGLVFRAPPSLAPGSTSRGPDPGAPGCHQGAGTVLSSR